MRTVRIMALLIVWLIVLFLYTLIMAIPYLGWIYIGGGDDRGPDGGLPVPAEKSDTSGVGFSIFSL